MQASLKSLKRNIRRTWWGMGAGLGVDALAALQAVGGGCLRHIDRHDVDGLALDGP